MKRHKPTPTLNPHAEQGQCPRCGSFNIDWNDTDNNGNTTYEYYTCNDCEFSFQSRFTRVFDYHITEDGTPIT